MEKWSAEQLPALVSGITINCSDNYFFTPSLSLAVHKSFVFPSFVSRSLCLFPYFTLCLFLSGLWVEQLDPVECLQ